MKARAQLVDQIESPRRDVPAPGIVEAVAPEEPDGDESGVDEAGRESFPASDPPSWTLGVAPRVARVS